MYTKYQKFICRLFFSMFLKLNNVLFHGSGSSGTNCKSNTVDGCSNGTGKVTGTFLSLGEIQGSPRTRVSSKALKSTGPVFMKSAPATPSNGHASMAA